MRIRFHPTTIQTNTIRRSALTVANVLLDKMPTGVIDSGATDHFVDTTYDGGAHRDTQDGIRVKVADNRIITATGTDLLPYEELPTTTRLCHKLPQLSAPLLSVGKFCDSGMIVLFDANNVYVCAKKQIDLPAIVDNNEIIR